MYGIGEKELLFIVIPIICSIYHTVLQRKKAALHGDGRSPAFLFPLS